MRIHAHAGTGCFLALVLLSAGCEQDGTADPLLSVAASKPAPVPPPPGGELYPQFGNAGVDLSDPSVGTGQANDVLFIDSSIYVGGSFRILASGDTTGRWKIEKRNASTGALDSHFGGGIAPFGTITRLAADSESLYAAGIELLGIHPDGQPNFAWRIEKRKLRTGALVRTFGANGVLTLDFSPYSDLCRSLIVDGPDLYLIGEDMIPYDPTGPVRQQWRIEKRSASTGAPNLAFGSSGAVTYTQDPGPGGAFSAEARDAVLVAGSLVVAGTINGAWRIEKRDRTTGTLDPAFGPGGVVTRDPGFNLDEARRIATDGTSLYVAGTQEYLDGRAWRIEKFSAATGGTDSSFGSGGVLFPLSIDINTEPRAMMVAAGALYVGGIHSVSPNYGDSHWTLVKIQTADGTLAPSFGLGGVLDLNPSPGIDAIGGLSTDGQALYIVGSQEESRWRIEKRAR